MNWLTTLKSVFLLFVLAHTVLAVIGYRRRAGAEDEPEAGQVISRFGLPKKRKFPLLLQVPIFYCACYLAYRQGVFSRELVSPLHIGLGLLAGHLVFGVSLFITHRCIVTTWSHFIDLGSLWNYALESPIVLGRFLLVAFAEELIWRVAAQTALLEIFSLYGPAWPESARFGLVLLIIAVFFAVAHKHFFENSVVVSIEFLAFAILLGVLYHYTSSFILVIVVHALRDIEIAYLEYLIKLEELGDKDLALQEVERSIIRRPRPESS